MSGKINRIYEALIKGAETGLSGNELFKHVSGRDAGSFTAATDWPAKPG